MFLDGQTRGFYNTDPSGFNPNLIPNRRTSIDKLTDEDKAVLRKAAGVDLNEEEADPQTARKLRYKALYDPGVPQRVVDYLDNDASGMLVRISGEFLFWALVRKNFLDTGIADWGLALYVGDVHSEFVHKRMDTFYFLDTINSALDSSPGESYSRYVENGKYALMMNGIFRGRPHSVAGQEPKGGKYRDARDPSYYNAVGRSSFASAMQYRLADYMGLSKIFSELVLLFPQVTKSLQFMAQRHFKIGKAESIDEIIMVLEYNLRERVSYGNLGEPPSTN